MTRFARAKGSKASNERVHDEATPWHVMKQQLESAVATKEIKKEKTKTAKELLKEKDDVFYADPTGNLNTDWAEFEPDKSTKTPKPSKQNKVKQENSPAVTEELGAVTPGKKSKKRKSEVSVEPSDKKASKPTEIKAPSPKKIKTENENPINKILFTHERAMMKAEKHKKRRQEKKLKIKARILLENKNGNNDEKKDDAAAVEVKNENNVKVENENNVEEKKEINDDKKPEERLSKRQKRNRKNKLKNEENESADKPEEKTDNSGPQQNGNSNFTRQNNFQSSNENFNNGIKRKLPKVRNDLEHKRRKPEPPSQKLIINSMEVEIVHYDGFPVKKEDAERLKDLRAQMVLKGIPKNQINAAMKLERRKAEKALTRIKKCVCFHCRKAGHNLSECPELGQEEVATGICFKCGSTEHTHFECKVVKKDDYKFAKCFICREQGHVAKQCPDNPKGLYPQGGACKICGDVTHLRKDCPDLQLEKEDDTMKLETIGNSNLESLDDGLSRKKNDEPKKPAKQVVKF